MGSIIRFGSVESGRIDETYSVFGVHSEAVNRCNTKTVEIQTEGGNWFLDIRAFDDGIIQHVNTISQSDSIKLTIRPKGGFVAELTKI